MTCRTIAAYSIDMTETRNRYETAFKSELPERPRKTLEYETAAERFNARLVNRLNWQLKPVIPRPGTGR